MVKWARVCVCGGGEVLIGSDIFVFREWIVNPIVVDMYEGPLHVLHRFQSPLEWLPDIVSLAKGHVLRKYDVDLDQEVIPGMEGLDRVDRRDLRVVIDGDPRDFLEEVRRSRVSRQHFDLLCTKWKK